MATERKVESKEFEGDILEEKVLYSWKSESRAFKKRSKDFYSTVIVLALLISVILFFIEGVMPVILVWSIVFVIWVLSKTPPDTVEHQITNRGIRTGGDLYDWEEMANFWIEGKQAPKTLRILLTRRWPGQLAMLVTDKDEDKVKNLVGKQVVLEKPQPSWTDRLVDWFGKKVPLEEG